jgi:4-hydroxy-tetrahydrodipicolinate reductase
VKNRVIQWTTGNVGSRALRAIIEHPELELVGVYTHSEDKLNKDAAELCGLSEDTGVLATNDIEALLALEADCVNYNTLKPATEELERLLESGLNVVGTAAYITASRLGKDSTERLEAACRRGRSSLYGTGINPGTSNILALVASGLCDRIHSVSVTESVDVTDYASRETWEGMGWAKPIGAPEQRTDTEERTRELREAMEMTAEGLGIEIDDVKFENEYAVTKDEIVLPYMTYPAGTVAGQRSTYHGMVDGRSVVRQHIVYRVRGNLEPEFPLVHGYLAEIEGEPGIRVETRLAKPTVPNINRETTYMGSDMVATAMPAINAIPAVCAAPAGIRRAYELPTITARGLLYP